MLHGGVTCSYYFAFRRKCTRRLPRSCRHRHRETKMSGEEVDGTEEEGHLDSLNGLSMTAATCPRRICLVAL